jgi:hypothetical protein
VANQGEARAAAAMAQNVAAATDQEDLLHWPRRLGSRQCSRDGRGDLAAAMGRMRGEPGTHQEAGVLAGSEREEKEEGEKRLGFGRFHDRRGKWTLDY